MRVSARRKRQPGVPVSRPLVRVRLSAGEASVVAKRRQVDMFFHLDRVSRGRISGKRLPARASVSFFEVADGRLGKHESIRRFSALERALDYDLPAKSARETQNLAVAPILPEELAPRRSLAIPRGRRRDASGDWGHHR